MTKEYKFIAENTKGAIETQDGIYIPLKEVEEIMQKWLEEQLTITVVSQQRELLEWLSSENYFNIPKDEISEILDDWKTYNSNCG